jgi:hypothetical protein
MKAIAGAGLAIFASLFLVTGVATAQPAANMGCSLENPTSTAQTLRCGGGVTIVAENGARFTLLDRDGNGRVDSVELSSKALLLEVPKKAGGNRFEVMTPQAIAAVHKMGGGYHGRQEFGFCGQRTGECGAARGCQSCRARARRGRRCGSDRRLDGEALAARPCRRFAGAPCTINTADG